MIGRLEGIDRIWIGPMRRIGPMGQNKNTYNDRTDNGMKKGYTLEQEMSVITGK
jgi:hypothetical protein